MGWPKKDGGWGGGGMTPLTNYGLNFTLDSEDLFCWCKQKKWFLWTMAVAQAVENHVDEWGLAWYNEGYKHQVKPDPTHKIH